MASVFTPRRVAAPERGGRLCVAGSSSLHMGAQLAGVGAFSAWAVGVCALHAAMVCPLLCNRIPRAYDRAAWPSTIWGTLL